MIEVLRHHAGSADEGDLLTTRSLFIAWVLAGLLLCAGLGNAPLRRTQEARVLETARQMVQPQIDHRPALQRWLLPSLNGEWRLRKPPLAYWMSAAAYQSGGVSRFSGRLPSVVCGWLALLVTFCCGRWLMGTRAGAVSALCLLSSYLFYRFDRLAETDAPAMLFCTLAMYAWWRALAGEEVHARPPQEQATNVSAQSQMQLCLITRSRRWYLVGAVATAGAILSKGGPGVFPPIFMLAMILIYRRWSAVRAFLFSGAPLVLVLLAAPWFLYVEHAIRSDQFRSEVDVLLGGDDHPGSVLQYILLLLVATVPWSGLMVAALCSAITRAYRGSGDRVSAGLLIWIAAIFVPLCCVGNKQPHYLLPIMPPLMMLVGWWLETSLFGVGNLDRVSRSMAQLIVKATLIATLVVVPAVLIVSKKLTHQIRPIDVEVAITTGLLLMIVAFIYRARGVRSALAAYIGAACLLMALLVGIWMPHLEPDESRRLAEQIHAQFGEGPYAYWGHGLSLGLCFELRQAMPYVHTPDELTAFAAGRPKAAVIMKRAPKGVEAVPPAPFAEAAHFRTGTQTFVIYQRDAVLELKARAPLAH